MSDLDDLKAECARIRDDYLAAIKEFPRPRSHEEQQWIWHLESELHKAKQAIWYYKGECDVHG